MIRKSAKRLHGVSGNNLQKGAAKEKSQNFSIVLTILLIVILGVAILAGVSKLLSECVRQSGAEIPCEQYSIYFHWESSGDTEA